MDMVISYLLHEQTRFVATCIFVGAVAFDFLLSHDGLPQNSVRESLLNIAKRGLYLGPWRLLPGSVLPYTLGVLLGHFYHPPTPIRTETYGNLGLVIAIGVLLALSTHFYRFPQNRHVFWVALFGVVVGAAIWPV